MEDHLTMRRTTGVGRTVGRPTDLPDTPAPQGTAPVAAPRFTSGRRAAGVAAAVVAGAAMAVQSRINGELGIRLHDGIAAAMVSFGVGMVLMLALVPTTPAGRRGLAAVRAAIRAGRLRPWQCLGGVCGAYLVVTQGVTVATLGVAVYTVAVVAGQSGSSLAVDRAGLSPSGRHPVTATRLIGATLSVAAVLITVWDRLGSGRVLGLALLPALAGAGAAWQTAVNGRVRVAAGAALPATFVNFVAGTSALLVAFGVDVAVRGWPTGALPREPWLYLGGPLGMSFILLAVSLVRLTGVLLLGLGMIAGQVVGAVLIDVVSPTPATPIGPHTLLGAGLTLVAVAVAALPGGVPRRRPGGLPKRWRRASRRPMSGPGTGARPGR